MSFSYTTLKYIYSDYSRNESCSIDIADGQFQHFLGFLPLCGANFVNL